MTLSIAGKTAIVTGSAKGIGLAIARHFVDLGANVMFADIDEARLESELGEAAQEDGPLRYFAGDLSQKLTAANLLSATVDAFDRIDILVNANRDFAITDPLNPEDPAFDMLSRGKRSLVLDLKTDAGRRTALDMVARADVVIDNIAPSSMIAYPEAGAVLDDRNVLVWGLAADGWSVAQVDVSLDGGTTWNAAQFGAAANGRRVGCRQHPGTQARVLLHEPGELAHRCAVVVDHPQQAQQDLGRRRRAP